MGEHWDDSTQSKEKIEASLVSKQEATIRTERALAYAFSHQVGAFLILENRCQSTFFFLSFDNSILKIVSKFVLCSGRAVQGPPTQCL
jgi:hypothetical protein